MGQGEIFFFSLTKELVIFVLFYICFHSLHICSKTSDSVCVHAHACAHARARLSMHMRAFIHVCVIVLLHILLPVGVVAKAFKV
jgi:hypothetical protein